MVFKIIFDMNEYSDWLTSVIWENLTILFEIKDTTHGPSIVGHSI